MSKEVEKKEVKDNFLGRFYLFCGILIFNFLGDPDLIDQPRIGLGIFTVVVFLFLPEILTATFWCWSRLVKITGHRNNTD